MRQPARRVPAVHAFLLASPHNITAAILPPSAFELGIFPLRGVAGDALQKLRLAIENFGWLGWLGRSDGTAGSVKPEFPAPSPSPGFAAVFIRQLLPTIKHWHHGRGPRPQLMALR